MTAKQELSIVIASLLLAIASRMPTVTQPLLEAHGFRQTQTAFQALIFHESGIDLLRPQVPVFGTPWTLPFEFPLFQALAVLPMDLGIEPDSALRLTGLACFTVAAAMLWIVLRRVGDRVAAIAALLAFLFSPFAMVWSRTSMIEYLVVAAGLGYVWSAMAWRDRHATMPWLVSVLFGSIAMMVKFQSSFFWAVPLLAYRSRGAARWRDPGLLALVAIPLLSGLAWTRYADAARTADGARPWLGASALADFLFGAPLDRLDPRAWAFLLGVLLGIVVGPGLLIALWSLRGAFVDRAQRAFWLSFIAAPFVSVLVFFNVYRLHDYYAASLTPALAAAVGLGASSLWSRRDLARAFLPVIPLAVVLDFVWLPLPSAIAIGVLVIAIAALGWRLVRQGSLSARRALPLVAVALLGLNLAATSTYWVPAYWPASDVDSGRLLPRAAELAALSAPEDLVVAVGHDWAPDLFYYARRRGFMLPQWLLEAPAFKDVDLSAYTRLHAWDPEHDPLWPVARSTWVGAIGAHTWALGRTFAELRGAPLAATDDEGAFVAAASAGSRLLREPLTLPCGRDVALASGRAGTWLRVAPAGRDARVRISRELAPVPARGVIVVSSPAGELSIRCSGAEAIVVTEVLDAPPPR